MFLDLQERIQKQRAEIYGHPSRLEADLTERSAWIIALCAIQVAPDDHLDYLHQAARAAKHRWQAAGKKEEAAGWCQWLDKALAGAGSMAHRVVRKQATSCQAPYEADKPLAGQLAREQADCQEQWCRDLGTREQILQ